MSKKDDRKAKIYRFLNPDRFLKPLARHRDWYLKFFGPLIETTVVTVDIGKRIVVIALVSFGFTLGLLFFGASRRYAIPIGIIIAIFQYCLLFKGEDKGDIKIEGGRTLDERPENKDDDD